MTRSGFWKRGAITVLLLIPLLAFGMYREATAANIEDFDWVSFTSGLIYGLLLMVLWATAIADGVANGLNAFLDWLDR